MTNDLIPIPPHPLVQAGQIANQVAGAGVFADYRSRKAENTRTRQDNDLALFADCLKVKLNFAEDPQAWHGITWGLVDGFRRWLLAQGYAVGSVNVTLATVRVYASLAAKAGTLEEQELVLIRSVAGYRRAEAKHIDQAREQDGIPIRRTERHTRAGKLTRGGKKSEPTLLTHSQAEQLKSQPDTPQGRRDRLLLCLLLDHGLRVGEAALLAVENFDLESGYVQFYRPKVDKLQTHVLTRDTLEAARAYLKLDGPEEGLIWRGSRRSKRLSSQGMTSRALTKRVTTLGSRLQIARLSAHDCRHYWASEAARHGTPIERLKDGGGWSTYAMPERYVKAAKIANEGVKLE